MLWSYVALIVVFGVLAALVQPVINSLPFWIRIIQMKNIWAIVSAGVYTCAISGLIFDIIRSPQMYYLLHYIARIEYYFGIHTTNLGLCLKCLVLLGTTPILRQGR